MEQLLPPGLLPPGVARSPGSPLTDWILPDPGLASVVLSHLAPADVRGLRAACKAACAAVAGHAWDVDLPRLYDFRASAWQSSIERDIKLKAPELEFSDSYVVTGPMALRRWRACFPNARTVVVHYSEAVRAPVTDAAIALLAGVTRLELWNCDVTREGLAPLSRPAPLTTLRELSLMNTWVNTDAFAATLQSAHTRLRWFNAQDHFTRMPKYKLAALSAATYVMLDTANDVTDAIIAEVLRFVQHVELLVDVRGFDGSGFSACQFLRSLRPKRFSRLGEVPTLKDDCFLVPGRPHSLLTFLHTTGIDVSDSVFEPLVLLDHVEIAGAPRLSDAAFDGKNLLSHLSVSCCPGFVGERLAEQAPRLQSLRVIDCFAFIGVGLRNHDALQHLTVRSCPAFSTAMLPRMSGGLLELTLDSMPDLTDDDLAPFTSLTRLDVSFCRRLHGAKLPAAPLKYVRILCCDMFLERAFRSWCVWKI